MYLCGCTRCNNIYIDPTQKDGVNYSDDLYDKMDFQLLVLLRGAYCCTECRSDAYLTDDIVGTYLVNFPQNRPKILAAARSLDPIKSKEESEEYEKLKRLLTRADCHKDIHQLLETEELPIPNGRPLSHSEREKLDNHFSHNYSFCFNLSSDGKLYFGFLDDEYSETHIRTWGYITEAQINNIMRPPKVVKQPKKNNTLESLSWYKKLMKNIR